MRAPQYSPRSEEHTSELQSHVKLVCRLLLEKKKRVATDLERIGDIAKNMGKRVAALESDFQPLKLIRGLEHMTDLVTSQVKSVFFFLMIRHPPRSTLFPTRRSSD